MSSLYLDLKDRTRVVDFLWEVLPFLPADNLVRTRAEAVIREVENGEKVSKEALADLAKTVGRATWVPRIAVKRYLKTGAGAEEEWRRVAAAVSNSTEHLLNRFRDDVEAASIDEVLGHADSPLAFRDVERMEIAEVRLHVLPTIWIDKRNEIEDQAEKAERELDGIEKALKKLHAIAYSDPRAPEREIVAKVEEFEDRLLFAGEELDPKHIEAEVASYREQIALPAEE